jgi:hypothetical protein
VRFVQRYHRGWHQHNNLPGAATGLTRFRGIPPAEVLLLRRSKHGSSAVCSCEAIERADRPSLAVQVSAGTRGRSSDYSPAEKEFHESPTTRLWHPVMGWCSNLSRSRLTRRRQRQIEYSSQSEPAARLNGALVGSCSCVFDVFLGVLLGTGRNIASGRVRHTFLAAVSPSGYTWRQPLRPRNFVGRSLVRAP